MRLNSFNLPMEGANSDKQELAFLRNQVMVLNERLKEAEKYKSSFFSNMRNDIINPFSSILSLSGLLLRGEKSNKEQVHKMLSHIYQETFALDFHLKTIFLAAEIECGECYPRPAFIRPEEVIAETLVALDHLMRKKKVRLVVYQSFEEDFWGDAEKLQMIFLGLLYNILIKSRPGDGISVKVYSKEETLYAEMYNSSLMGQRRSLFDLAYFKEICMFNENIEGIHLSVARSLTETLNGKMEAGEYKGEIAAFRFSIPEVRDGADQDVFEGQSLIFR